MARTPTKPVAKPNAPTQASKQQSCTLPTTAINFEADAGKGMEGSDKDSFAIPFVAILQANSPQVEAGTVKGARAGLFINTITNELAEQIEVIPCAFQRRFLRWAPRKQGGGYKGDYSPVDVELNRIKGLQHVEKDGKTKLQVEGDDLRDTRSHFCLVKAANGAWSPAMISFASTQIKKSKRWMSRINGVEMQNAAGKSFNPPSFSHSYILKSVREENAEGAWYGFEIDIVGPVQDSDVYAAARDFHAKVVAGKVQVSEPTHDPAAGQPEEGRDGKF